mmetsp:Transcript_8109/g.7683  ORF Transcript_8109/g.7683 Transcript_8109/m.7683 type:complete len:87 (-) Transcript_8109:345-605(-)
MYIAKVNRLATAIFQLNLFTTEYTLSSSTMIKALKVMVTRFANESLKRAMHQNIIKPPWKILFQTQIRKVFNDRDLPFCKVLYSGG